MAGIPKLARWLTYQPVLRPPPVWHSLTSARGAFGTLGTHCLAIRPLGHWASLSCMASYTKGATATALFATRDSERAKRREKQKS